MLEITIPGREYWDEKNETFVTFQDTKIVLEHSLVSLSKWESKWKKPFISKTPKTLDETLDYVRCMTITQCVDPSIYNQLSAEQLKTINDYIDDPMTATWFRNDDSRPSSEQVTSELIYYWMVAAGIPFECQKWHLNRLFTLIRIYSIKSQPSKKMSRNDIYRSNNALNAARRKKLHTRG